MSPLRKQKTPAAFSANVKELVGSGKKLPQALAIAYSVKRRSQKQSDKKKKK